MKVKCIQIQNTPVEALTLGKVYECTGISPYGNAYIIDDEGEESILYVREFEILEDKKVWCKQCENYVSIDKPYCSCEFITNLKCDFEEVKND